MFCFQCQQTANGTGCTIAGVCGKNSQTADEQDILTCEMISLANIVQLKGLDYVLSPEIVEVVDMIVEGLFACVTNVNFSFEKISILTGQVKTRREKLDGALIIKPDELFSGDEDIRSFRSALLFGLRGMAAYAHHARILGKRVIEIDFWFINGMAALGKNHTIKEWLELLMEFGNENLKCMEILDIANTDAFGNPVPVQVSLKIEKGPFIVITGHDLYDLKMLLSQTEGKGINVYTHGEMLPAHGYPELKKYPHFKGHFGTAWQNQQNEFNNIPAPVLFTTNCIMPPWESYADRVYTTSAVHFNEIPHIDADSKGYKDFSVVIEHALKLGGYAEDVQLTGINGGVFVTTGYGRQTMLDNVPLIIDAVKKGEIKHIFLVGGCDGAHKERSYYTDFVKQTPADTLVFTLACGKFRFNDLNIGSIGTFPRIIDMGQCNDSLSAIKTAVALLDAFNCGINELPLTLVLSWYEQKAVCVLLTLLSLGIKNIYIGPSAPAFFSEEVLKIIVEKFNLNLISTPENDLAKILGN